MIFQKTEIPATFEWTKIDFSDLDCRGGITVSNSGFIAFCRDKKIHLRDESVSELVPEIKLNLLSVPGGPARRIPINCTVPGTGSGLHGSSGGISVNNTIANSLGRSYRSAGGITVNNTVAGGSRGHRGSP